MGKRQEKEIYLCANQIGQLKYDAEGFYNAFYLLCNSLQAKQGVEAWEQNGDILSVLGTIGSFALELYLKLLHALTTFDESKKIGFHYKEHKLNILYEHIESKSIEFIKQLEENYKNSFNTNIYHDSLASFLASIQEDFIDWRYSYENKKELKVNLDELSNALKVLNWLAKEKFISIPNFITSDKNVPHFITVNNWSMLTKEELTLQKDDE